MRRSTLIIVLCTLALTATAVRAEQRYALVIGNGSYQSIDPLPNPPNDVRLIAERLLAVDFEVTLLVDANMREMDVAAREFARALDDAGKNTVGLFYFAGHGVTYNGQNWLIPVGADIREGIDIEYGTMSANKVLGLMESARNNTDILILDACRNSPFRSFSLSGTRAISVGMKRMDAPAGSFIAYSTAPGEVAYDGSGDYSPFAAAFAAEIGSPGISIGDMMIDVSKRVQDTTEHLGGTTQTPWTASSLTDRFLFKSASAVTANTGSAQAAPQPQQTNTATNRQSSEGAEQRYWAAVQGSEDPREYEAYLNRYPSGEFADLARARRDRYAASAAGDAAAGLAGSGGQVTATAGEGVAGTPQGLADYTVTPEKFRGIVSSATGVFEAPDQMSRRYRRLGVGEVVNVIGRVENRLWFQVDLGDGTQGFAAMSSIERF